MSRRLTAFRAVIGRELVTVVRTRAYLALTVGFGLAVLAAAWLSGGAGYATLALALVTPLELLVPVLVAAGAYRTILGDRERGELAVFRTYPLSGWTYVAGAYAGRATVIVAATLAPLVAVFLAVPLVAGSSGTFLAQHGGLDSPVLFVRFVVLTALYAAAATGLVVALSAVVRGTSRGLAAALGLVVVLAVGTDLAVVMGLATGVVERGALPAVLALSPASAYRGLVLRFVVDPAVTGSVGSVPPALALVGLIVPPTLALSLGAWLLDRRGGVETTETVEPTDRPSAVESSD